MIWIITLIIGSIILIVTLIQNNTIRNQYNAELKDATDNLEYEKKKHLEAFSPIYELIYEHFGDKYIDLLTNRKICEGMPTEILTLSWGKPGNVKTSYFKGVESQSWFYNSYYNRLGNKKFRTEVRIENNIIVGWRDLN